MVLDANDTYAYTRKDLQCMNMLVRPAWVFDIDAKSMFWANTAALEHVWDAGSLDEIIQRDFKSDMSGSSKSWLHDFQQNVLHDNLYTASEKWTFYPKGAAQILDVTCSGIRISSSSPTMNAVDADRFNGTSRGSIAMLVEVELNHTKIADTTSRSLELLRHLPMAVSQFSMDGSQLIYQNPMALQLFGSLAAQITPAEDVSKSEEEKYHADNNNNDDANSCFSNEFLLRFVDIELAHQALKSMEQNEIFSTETKLYINPQLSSSEAASTTSVVPHSESSSSTTSLREKTVKKTFKRRSIRRGSNDSTSDTDDMTPKRWFNVLLRKARDPVTSEYAIVFIARDISDIVQARKDSVRAAMKSDFLDVMAHEIRTPLHQIVGYMDLLEDDDHPLSKDQINSVQQVQGSCALLIAIINDLLDCSKLEYGQLQIENVSFLLPTVVEGCLSAIGPQSQSKGLQLHCKIDTSCALTQHCVVSDPNRLRQILQNLLSNAVKFTNKGSITLKVKTLSHVANTSCDLCNGHQSDNNNVEQTQWFRFEVIDTGIGIALDEQSLVFERYKQANASVARNFGGTGLGLPICKGLVELLGGTIGLYSEAGKGTTVYFELPLRVQPLELTTSNGSSSNRLVQRLPSITIDSLSLKDDTALAMNILVVEDNKINQKLLKAMLQRLGHNVTLAEDGEIALREIRQQRFHVVLMDVQMPVMDGIECTKRIRNVLRYSKEELPILGLTAGYQNSDQDFYINEVGMNLCLGKPLPMEALKKALSCYSKKPEYGGAQ